MSQWEYIKAAKLVTFRTGKLDSNAAEEGGKYPFFTCAQTTYRINKYAFDTECVLLAGNNAAGIFPLKYFKGKFNAYQRTYIIEPIEREKLSTRYLYFYLRPLLKGFEAQATGATTKFLTLKILNNLYIAVPPIEVQEKIAAVLSAYDELIENNQHRIALLERMAEELYREWFVRMRFPGFEDTVFEGGIPVNWTYKRIGKICQKITDGSHYSPPFVEGGLYMASVKDMLKNGFSLRDMKTISENDFRKLERSDCRPLKNDVLIAKDGSYLKCVFVWNEDIDLVVLSSIAILRPDVAEVSPYFLALTLQEETIKTMMSGYVSGSALPRIILDDFKKMKLLIPELSLLNCFEAKVEQIYEQIRELDRLSNLLKKTRDLLLPRLISGRLSVENLDIALPLGMMEKETNY